MMERRIRALCGALAVCALAACGGGRDDGDAKQAQSGNPDSMANSASAPDTTTAQGAQQAGLKPLDTTAAAVASGVEVTVDSAAGAGMFLADKVGRPLYLYTADKNGEPACYDACAALWPPVIALQGTASAGSAGVKPELLGTARRRDGNMQVTYNKHPLYYYARDQGSGPPRGNDVKDAGGEWYLVTPAGEKAEEHEGHEDGDRS